MSFSQIFNDTDNVIPEFVQLAIFNQKMHPFSSLVEAVEAMV